MKQLKVYINKETKASPMLKSKFNSLFESSLQAKKWFNLKELNEVSDNTVIEDKNQKHSPASYIFNISFPSKDHRMPNKTVGSQNSHKNLFSVSNFKGPKIFSLKNKENFKIGSPPQKLFNVSEYANRTKASLIQEIEQLKKERDLYYNLYKKANKI